MIFKGIYCSNTPAEIKMERIYMKIEGLKVHLLALSDTCIMLYASTSFCFKEERVVSRSESECCGTASPVGWERIQKEEKEIGGGG